MKRFLSSLLVLAFIFGRTASAADAEHRFEKDIKAFEAQDQKTPPAPGAILFVGDSTYTNWKTIHEDLPEYNLINRGFGGSGMSDLLYFTDRLVLAYKPRLVVVQEGGNDIHGGRTPEQFLADLKGFVEKVQSALPQARLIICSITPNPARWGEVEARRRTNRLTQEFAATQKNVTYVNLFDPFLGPSGQPREELYVADRVHPSHAGYELRVRILRPLLGAPDRAP